MDMVEKLNNKFSVWYESLFGDHGNSELRPKDVLRKILRAMDDNRSEGIDGKIYVPNRYILILNLADNEERDYLLSFLDEDELSAVLQRYMAQNGYAVRGPLDFTITDEAAGITTNGAKLTVKARYEKGQIDAPDPAVVAERESNHDGVEDLPTVASLPYEDLPTVADIPSSWGSLAATEPSGKRSLITLHGGTYTIGRSRNTANDLVLSNDGKVSKIHARLVLESDGKVTLYDLASTNGVLVNGRKVAESVLLTPEDTIVIGDTELIFRQEEAIAPKASPSDAKKRAILSPSNGGPDYVLASDNLIGRSITCDLVLNDPNGANRQAEIVAHTGGTYTIEDLAGKHSTLLNERVIQTGERIKLTNGDRIQLGILSFQYIENQF